MRITSSPKASSSSFAGSDSADESLDDSESSNFEQLLEFLQLPSEFSAEESSAANAMAFLFDRFGLTLLKAYFTERNGVEDLPLNSMVGKPIYCLLHYYKEYHQISNSQLNFFSQE